MFDDNPSQPGQQTPPNPMPGTSTPPAPEPNVPPPPPTPPVPAPEPPTMPPMGGDEEPSGGSTPGGMPTPPAA